MKSCKVKVRNEAESKEAQELLFKLNLEKSNWSNFSLPKFIAARIAENNFSDYILGDVGMYKYKEITLPELRAMVNPMKEYLVKSIHGEYVVVDHHSGFDVNELIEIPEGAIRARFYPNDPDALEFEGDFCQWWHDKDNEWINYENYSNTLEHSRVVWQRDQDEPFLTPECTLNDQYAEIEQVRQVEIYGTVKAEPDLNFGAAQASDGAKMRENNHYFINVSDVDEVDFYEIAKRYNVTDPAIQHILKKCLAIGNRGHKDLETDLKDILKTAKRALQINGFGE